jgi:RNA polymerase sigma factor (sigma-70 family)
MGHMSPVSLNIYRLAADRPIPCEHWEFNQQDVIQVGRHPGNDLVLSDKRVSRSHATLFHDGQSWHCAAFGANGIAVGGLQLPHVQIRHGLTVSLAGHEGPRLLFEMPGSDEDEQIRGSVTFLVEELREGSQEALEKLWARCFATVVRLARQRLGHASRRVVDEEDVAIGVFSSLFDSSSAGRLPELHDRESLWRLLITMTTNRAKNVIRDQRRAKRGGGLVRGDSIGDLTEFRLSTTGPSAFDNLLGHEPTPDAIIAINEQISEWLARLPDDEHRQIALRRMEGFTNDEIASLVEIPLRTVERRLHLIRAAWTDEST